MAQDAKLAMGTKASSLWGKISMLCYVSETFPGAAEGACLRRKLSWAVRMPEEQRVHRGMVQHGQPAEANPSQEMAAAAGTRALEQAFCCGPAWRGKAARAGS